MEDDETLLLILNERILKYLNILFILSILRIESLHIPSRILTLFFKIKIIILYNEIQGKGI